MKGFFKSTLLNFAWLGIIFIPVTSYVLPFQSKLVVWCFGDVVNLIIDDHLDFTSDTFGLNILLIFLLLIAMLITALVRITPYFVERKTQIENLIRLIIFYYIASRMMVYGFDKIFKTQFYLPEPNIMYTDFGLLSKDILFWSVMGTSKWYCILSGIAEVIPAVLLLFKRTRIFGLCWMLLVLVHVLTINIGFDISVKLYTLFLLFLTLLLLSKHFSAIYTFFIRQENAKLQAVVSLLEGKSHFKKGLKFFAIGMIFIEALKFPISTGYLSDDDFPRPSLHGAYSVVGANNLSGHFVEHPYLFERVFVHRDDYLIFQSGRVLDSYKMELDTIERVFRLTDNEFYGMNEIPYELYKGESMDLMIYPGANFDTLWYQMIKLNYRELPVLQNDFHWTIDEFKND